eukprot:g44177.t1
MTTAAASSFASITLLTPSAANATKVDQRTCVLADQECPESFPFKCLGNYNDSACFNSKVDANHCYGPALSWCALPNAPPSLSSQIPHNGTWCPGICEALSA